MSLNIEYDKKTVNPRKVSQTKVCDYIRMVYIDGRSKVASYSEKIDPVIYSLSTPSRYKYISTLEERPDFAELKNAIMMEDQEEMLRRSSTAQRKAFNLLLDTIEAAQASIKENPTDPETLRSVTSVLKSLAPAFKAAEIEKKEEPITLEDKKARAARVIAGN